MTSEQDLRTFLLDPNPRFLVRQLVANSSHLDALYALWSYNLTATHHLQQQRELLFRELVANGIQTTVAPVMTVPTDPEPTPARPRPSISPLSKRKYRRPSTPSASKSPSSKRVVIDLTETPSSSSRKQDDYPYYMRYSLCNGCQRVGHFFSHCPLYKCDHCHRHQPGHYSHHCPLRDLPVEEDYEIFYDPLDPEAWANITEEPYGL
jgi:hypothetical protein